MVTVRMEEETLQRCRELVADLRTNGKAVDEATLDDLADLTHLDSEASVIRAERAGILIGLLIWNGLKRPLVD
jgi:hypothetical protein